MPLNNGIYKKYDALALFSGGLDSILSMKMVERQNLRVLGLHFISPFFGKPHKIAHWENIYEIELLGLDVSDEYVKMLLNGPKFGFGKFINPCLDCKIFMLKKAKTLIEPYGAKFIITGEVLGQRPMSQRRDALDIITREADVRDELLRPLSAGHLRPTRPEEEGLINRKKLGRVSGRGRREQMIMAEEFNIGEIPTPAGGCLLTEQESCRRYLPLFRSMCRPSAMDFHLANLGRQLWSRSDPSGWMILGRNKQDNEQLQKFAADKDYLFEIRNYPGPLGLGRSLCGRAWPEEMLAEAAALNACYSPKARKSRRGVEVILTHENTQKIIVVRPDFKEQCSGWTEPEWNKELFKKISEHNSKLMEAT